MRSSVGLALLVLSLPLSLRADTLAELRTAVGRLTAHQELHATFAQEVSIKASGKFANEANARSVVTEVVQEGRGVTITIPQGLVERASHGMSPDGESAQNAISAIRAADIIDAIDFRDSFLSMLRAATPSEERRVLFHGKPARLLVLKLNAPPRKKRNEVMLGSVKVAEDRLTVWIGDDNLPLAAERFQKTTAGFLIFHADTVQSTSYVFGHPGDRLIVVRLETKAGGSGLGQRIDTATVETMTVHSDSRSGN